MSAQAAPKTYEFKSDVAKVLDLVIHSLYSNKEIFLRELISNASDALDKQRYTALSDPSLYEGDTELRIWLSVDSENKTLTIHDNGVGMSEEEVVANLGTIARSGTQQFLRNLSDSDAKNSALIGQFGVGFYSAFIVADKVEVKTRKAKGEGVCWVSNGTNAYSIETCEKSTRGTDITLHLKEESTEFLNPMRLRHLIRTYSDHIGFPISLPAEKTDTETDAQDEVINQASALWTLHKNDITPEQYTEFYHHVAHDFSEPVLTLHQKVEGKYDYTMLVYVPGQAPFDLYQLDKPRGLKLYVKRVFIMDDAQQLIPTYLRFVRGVIDSRDLPLNVSRELLQSSKVVETIKAAVTKKVLKGLAELSSTNPEKYQQFWNAFGPVMKEGPAEDFANREAIAELLRFASTQENVATQNVSLDTYVSRMKSGQEKIYYLAADSFNAAKNSPHLEIFRKKGIEVLLLSDRIDEWLTSHLTEFKGKAFQSVARGSLEDLAFAQDAQTENTELPQAEYAQLITRMKTVLADKVKDIRLTKRLTDSPACLVADENAMTAQMQRVLKSAGQDVHNAPILELNPDHQMIKRLQKETGERLTDWTQILFDQALLAEGGHLDDPATFVKRFNQMLLSLL